ncbi:MAG: metal ABC transporter permease [Melioribacteraceae bacterium]|nr:metal ABC transporter permease [Melioribacteraceae bacterium]MCF8264743.1 metal ABC transporter permease [Melioribacteraceae bacterium]MCF8413315.1 metal ABC transporter permease [Melioribacteraceae bacterium]MCF8432616.1 metal ABC transporter permease [Melioribacteraceae bacterium]
MTELFQYDFMINALLAGLLASIATGIIGSFVVVRKLGYIAGGISHSAYGGIGIAFLIGMNPILGALIFSLLAALIITYFRTSNRSNEDMLISILWSTGFAIGTLFISLSDSYTPNLMSFLFGNILTIPITEIYIALVLDLIIIALVFVFFKKLEVVSFDEEYAKVLGINTIGYNALLFSLVAVTSVLLIKIVGIILVIALLTIPSSISLGFSKNLKKMIFSSIAIGLVFTLLGLLISYYLNLPSGSIIIICAVLGYLIYLGIDRLRGATN